VHMGMMRLPLMPPHCQQKHDARVWRNAVCGDGEQVLLQQGTKCIRMRAGSVGALRQRC
jgi:hypothetical protein